MNDSNVVIEDISNDITHEPIINPSVPSIPTPPPPPEPTPQPKDEVLI